MVSFLLNEEVCGEIQQNLVGLVCGKCDNL